eukprot:c16371_g1_i2 orf=573-899(+)
MGQGNVFQMFYFFQTCSLLSIQKYLFLKVVELSHELQEATHLGVHKYLPHRVVMEQAHLLFFGDSFSRQNYCWHFGCIVQAESFALMCFCNMVLFFCNPINQFGLQGL